MIFNEIRSRLNGCWIGREIREYERKSSIQSPVSFSLMNRGFFTSDPRRSRGGFPRAEGDGRKKLEKHVFRLCRVSVQGDGNNGPRAFPPFAWSPKRLFAGRTGPVSLPAIRRNMGSRSSVRSRDRGSSLIELKKKTRKIARRSTEARVASQSLDD